MKKQLTVVLLIFALLFATAGCSAANAVQKLDAAEDRVEEKLDTAENKLEDDLRKAVSPVPATGPDQAPAAPTQAPPATESTRRLTKEEALEIALDHLGLTADQVTRLRTEYEVDDGLPQFDVEFLQGDWEYEFEIHAETGQILSYDKDHKYD